jgi:hypothetical protein
MTDTILGDRQEKKRRFALQISDILHDKAKRRFFPDMPPVNPRHPE